MALLPNTPAAARADDLVDRLAAYGVAYITGGHGYDVRPPAPEQFAADQVVDLIRDLADAPAVRLADALIALLLRHPACAVAVRAVLTQLPSEDLRARPLLARLLAAAALQRIWSFVLQLYLGQQPAIDVADLCRELELPDPEQDHGEALLGATARWLDPTETVDWASGWEDAAAQLLSDLQLACA